MAVPTNLFAKYAVPAFKAQSDYVTEYDTNADTNWQWLDCEVMLPDNIQFGREVVDIERPQPTIGAVGTPVAASRFGGEVTIRATLEGMPADEWAALDDAVSSPTFGLATEAMCGSSYLLQAVADNCIAGSAGTTMNVTLSTGYEVGCLVAWGDSTDQTPVTGMGWIVTATDAATDTLTLAGTPATVAADTYDTLSTFNSALTLNQPTPITMRLVGHDVDWDLRLISLVPKSGTLKFVPGMPPEFTGVYNLGSYRWDEDNHGGLWDADTATRLRTPGTYQDLGGGAAWHAWKKLPALTKENGGRLLINGSAYTRGVGGGLEVKVENKIAYMKSPGGLQGVYGAVVTDRDVTVTFDVELQDSDITGTAGDQLDTWTEWFENGTAFELDLQLGNTPGQLFALYCPALLVVEQPQFATVGEQAVGIHVVAKPKVYSTDTVGDGVSAAQNTIFRIAVG